MHIFRLFIMATTAIAISGCQGLGTALQQAAEDTDATVVWRGFEHKWDHEVHRTGRFGNWIQADSMTAFPKEVSLHHAAQSGTNADSAAFNTHYDLLQATHTRFIPGSIHIADFDMEEEEIVPFERHVEIDITGGNKLTGKTELTALINGFDLSRRNGTAKKLGLLEVELSRPEIVGDKISFDVSGRLMLSCRSTECDVDEGAGPYRNDVHYNLDIYYLVVAGDPEFVSVLEHDTLGRSYAYDSHGDGVPESLGVFTDDISPTLSNGYQVNAMGMRKFRFEVSKNTDMFFPDPVPHLYTWRMYGDHSGLLTYTPKVSGRAFFAHSKNGATNHPHKGQARVEFDPVSLQFKVGLKKKCEWSESRSFPNNDGNPDSSVQSITGEIEKKGTLICIEAQT